MALKLFFTVTNDLTYDQRMIRICSSLVAKGYEVTLIGRKMPESIPLKQEPFQQVRLRMYFHKRFFFYAEYNIRLFFFLLSRKQDLICSIDLDSIIPGYLVSSFKNIHRVYDAHELFCEMKEIVTRPRVYRFWKWIERRCVPKFKWGYTVNEPIAEAFHKMYRVNYEVIRNMPMLKPIVLPAKPDPYIIYQGAVNEGRSFETLIPALRMVNAKLVICGDGNFMKQAKQLVLDNNLTGKIIFTGKLTPEALSTYTLNAYLGITLFDDRGLSNYYSLANRFFDYLHAGIPQLCVDYPVYRSIINEYEFALLISDLSPESIARHLNLLLTDDVLYNRLQDNCLSARELLNWNQEEKRLVSFYDKITGIGG